MPRKQEFSYQYMSRSQTSLRDPNVHTPSFILSSSWHTSRKCHKPYLNILVAYNTRTILNGWITIKAIRFHIYLVTVIIKILQSIIYSSKYYIWGAATAQSVQRLATDSHDRGVGFRVPVGSRIFSSPRRPDRFWGPRSLLSHGYRVPFPLV
jgi:hypothetical protein